jgi:long-chain acyl-CoA synthetase
MKTFNDDTISGNALNTANKYPDKAYLHSRYDKQGNRTDQVHTYTWSEANRAMRDINLALRSMGFKEFERSAVFASNRPRWLFAALAPIFLRGTFVPIYPTSKTEDVWWILHDSGSKFCFVGSKEHLNKVLEVKPKLPALEKIFVMDPIPEKPDPMVMTMNELLEIGAKLRDQDTELEKIADTVREEDLAIIMYTSGTTGKPKGVMLTHKNICSQRVLNDEFGFRPGDMLLAHLPFCHSYGFSADLMGGSYVPMEMAILDSLGTEEIRWGLSTFHPNVMNSVPRLWEKLYIQINQILSERPPFLQKYFKWGISVGSKAYLLKNEKKPVPLSIKIQQALTKPLFNLVKGKAGLDRLRLCSTGGGPINPDLIVFFGAMGIELFQGFGLTETAPIINANTPRNNKLGTCGKPLPGVIEKTAEDGEILVKGPQVMKGYWNNPTATKETFSPDGFFLTGDIGFVDEDGYLHITDRKKELFKTSGGKYVAPQPIEYAFNTNPYVEQVACVGDNRKYICALIVPEFNALNLWAKQNNIECKDNQELVCHEKVVAFMQEQVNQINQHLARYEQIKKFCLIGSSFSEEGGELTPSQKKKRRVIEKKYKDLIDKMYPPDDGM